jgi:hypothetical protein
MATSETAAQVELGDLIEVTARAVDRATSRIKNPFPGGATIGIIFQSPPNFPTVPAALSSADSFAFLGSLATKAGSLHGRFVAQAIKDGQPRRERVAKHLDNMTKLGLMSSEEAGHIAAMLESLRDNQQSLTDTHKEIGEWHASMRASATASPVALTIAGVIADSVERSVSTLPARFTPAQAARSKGVGSADGEGAVEGRGLGAIAGAEVGGGVGLGWGAVIGALLGGAIQSIGALLDDD